MCSQREPVCQTEHFPVPEGDAYFTVKLQDYTAVEKEQVVLDCELNKDVEVMWYHNEAEVKASKAVLIDHMSTVPLQQHSLFPGHLQDRIFSFMVTKFTTVFFSIFFF